MNSEKKKTYLLTIRTGYFAVAASLAILGTLCVGVTGIYFGSMQQARKDSDQLTAMRLELTDQQLRYEKRLGEQSARYALEAGQAVQSLQQLQAVIDSIQKQNRQFASDRQLAMQRATTAAENAASEAKAARDRLAELTQQSKETSAAVAVAASAAVAAASSTKETQRTLENATYPVAQPPKRSSK